MIGKMGVLALLVLLTRDAMPQANWKLTRDKDNIKIYTAKDDASGFKRIKVEAVMEGTLQKLVAVLMDVSNNKQWVYNTKQSYIIDRRDAKEIVYYAETALPWPLSNRDMVIKMSFDLDTINHKLKVLAVGMPDSLPVKKGLVRIQKFRAAWNVQYDGTGKIRIDYFLAVNPGGNIPAGISNMFVAKGPFETFSNLSKVLKNKPE